MKKAILLAAMLLAFAAAAYAGQCTSITQYGITWTFDREYECGQFVNGDYWVVGPVTVTGISPGWDGEKHGSMVNPDPGNRGSKGEYVYQAFDKRASSFDAGLLVEAPVALEPNSSLVSAVGWAVNEPGCPSLVGGIPRPVLIVSDISLGTFI